MSSPINEPQHPGKSGPSAEMLLFSCPCGQKLRMARSAQATRVRCSHCQRVLAIAASPQVATPPGASVSDTKGTFAPLAPQTADRAEKPVSPTQPSPALLTESFELPKCPGTGA